jgi:hypothetical protein
VDAADVVGGGRVDERGKREQFVWPHLECASYRCLISYFLVLH